ncbi:aminotransferase class III-fold pyridoxal phosphate-dependent enzyme [Sansalvadorimonas sp. 2012CJ34-2]|uniref:Aminotransferase class III-fold pyridoxal phosphate-dependent enzyme n=1 Tax=Parendozoicomonas callyspongiae TaxID=2942213 RepID=A0ABT0PDJ8_9GAMM|nr:aminotransferase class III-fold pyridoxal phosphate-dependent enzyme [Sansalvadorimonas sp. 2012CJ34-2]MCL6268822.1 aminotransferase class III-fold pyridoxal phosphate-dependent enzyme [Sansalvadorimonas sp. 2012CJ34-2]
MTNLNPIYNSEELLARAKKVIPNGVYGHQNVAMMNPGVPQFFQKAEGCRLWDVTGKEYIDYLCGYGTNMLGYNYPLVEEAVNQQRKDCDCMTGPSPKMVELAELLVNTVTHCDWAFFAKNGTDATTICVTTARAATRKKKVLAAKVAYHGADPWCTPIPAGVTPEDRAHMIYYKYNDIASFDKAVEQAGDDLAGVIVSAFKHDVFMDQEIPTREFAQHVRKVCDDTGAAMILDEVRAGFRVSLDVSWAKFVGVQPDLSAWCKAIANGHPISFVLGCEKFKTAASQIYSTGSYWFAASPMAAAITTIKEIQRLNLPVMLEKNGMMLRQGLDELAGKYGYELKQTGPAAIPMLLFNKDAIRKKGNFFCTEMLKNGVYFHPWHNMFLSAAHTEDVIVQTLQAADESFAAMQKAGV